MIEDAIHKGPYNTINNWDYSKVLSVIDPLGLKSVTFDVLTTNEFNTAIKKSLRSNKLCLLNCHISRTDVQKKLFKWGRDVGKYNSRKVNIIHNKWQNVKIKRSHLAEMPLVVIGTTIGVIFSYVACAIMCLCALYLMGLGIVGKYPLFENGYCTQKLKPRCGATEQDVKDLGALGILNQIHVVTDACSGMNKIHVIKHLAVIGLVPYITQLKLEYYIFVLEFYL